MTGIPLFSTPTLALDPADDTGWAYGNWDTFEHGAWHIKASGSEHAGARLVRLEKHILDTHERYGVKRIAFENASLGSRHENTKVYHNRVSGVILATAAKIGATWEHFSPVTIKAFAGHGRYDKTHMMAALKRHYQLDVTNGDECDAIWVLLLDEQRRTRPAGSEPVKARKSKPPRRRKAKERTLFDSVPLDTADPF